MIRVSYDTGFTYVQQHSRCFTTCHIQYRQVPNMFMFWFLIRVQVLHLGSVPFSFGFSTTYDVLKGVGSPTYVRTYLTYTRVPDGTGWYYTGTAVTRTGLL